MDNKTHSSHSLPWKDDAPPEEVSDALLADAVRAEQKQLVKESLVRPQNLPAVAQHLLHRPQEKLPPDLFAVLCEWLEHTHNATIRVTKGRVQAKWRQEVFPLIDSLIDAGMTEDEACRIAIAQYAQIIPEGSRDEENLGKAYRDYKKNRFTKEHAAHLRLRKAVTNEDDTLFDEAWNELAQG